MSFLIDNALEFIHVPKTGGMWIEHGCKPWITMVGNNRHDTGGNTGHLSFCVARTPYRWLCSLLAYTKRRWVVVEKGYPGWLLQTPFKEIGMMDCLKEKECNPENFITHYLDKLPGVFSQAYLQYLDNADRAIFMDAHFRKRTCDFMRRCGIQHGERIANQLKQLNPMNVSAFKLAHLDDSQLGTHLISALNESEEEYLSALRERRVV